MNILGQLGSNWSQSGSIGFNWVPIGSQLGCNWIPLDPTGPYGALLGPWPDCWEVASSQVTRIAIRSAFLELAAGPTGAAEVVSRTAARTPIPHAPGARMTVVTLTPSNYIYIYIYTSVDPCIYMHGVRRAEQRGAEHSVSRVQLFQTAILNSRLEQPSRTHRRHRSRLEQPLRAHSSPFAPFCAFLSERQGAPGQ